MSVGCLGDKAVSATCFILSIELDQPVSNRCMKWIRGPRMLAGVPGWTEGLHVEVLARFGQCGTAWGASVMRGQELPCARPSWLQNRSTAGHG